MFRSGLHRLLRGHTDTRVTQCDNDNSVVHGKPTQIGSKFSTFCCCVVFILFYRTPL